MHIAGIEKNTLLDYPGMVAATVFTGGCNLRCLFCQNKELVCSPPQIDEEEVMAFLKKRQGCIKGVCISGGEPLIQTDLTGFMGRIRDLGYKVKLDTNGTMSDALEDIIKRGLADYIAMDIKTDIPHYPGICGGKDTAVSGGTTPDIDSIKRSVELIKGSDVDHEFRTTVVKEYYNEEIADNVGRWLKGAKRYYLQAFRDSDTVLCGRGRLHPLGREEMENLAGIVGRYIPEVGLRGI